MSYAGSRICYDADSHLMELPDFFREFADPEVRDLLPELTVSSGGRFGEAVTKFAAARRLAPEEVARQTALGDTLITGPKGYFALGAFNRDERSQALDQLGFRKQLVFSTFAAGTIFRRMPGSPDLQYAAARAHNRAMAHFCADPRLMGIAALPLTSVPHALAEIDNIVALGLRAAWIPHQPAGDKSPGHTDLDPVWAKLAANGLPFALHVGGDPLQMDPAWINNGRPVPTDWLGGGENLRGKDMTVLHHAAETFLSVLVFDGVLQRHPGLRGIVVELGCGWVPELLVRLDWTHKTWSRSEPLLAELETSPSRQIIDRICVTPYPFENVGDIIRRSDPRLYMFASDYPHTEGSKAPMERFDKSLEGHDQATSDLFYSGNFMRQFALALEPSRVT
ncbi:MAG: amidohydrolase family protein [Alphaproteobacteria bacterium]|nr:amidohydrolase family protein [Alphaproteobacteria bacterium]